MRCHAEVAGGVNPGKEREMENDVEVLTRLNMEIGTIETAGDAAAHTWFEERLAAKLAFRRADLKTFDDRTEFIRKIAPSDPRETLVQSVDVNGNAAFVKCIVTVKSSNGERSYRNLRLFVRDGESWKLLGWANEGI
jgi:hypothetical protein